ncbi:MAG: ABC transporter ATP-binding protein [Gemmataceae bacterium]
MTGAILSKKAELGNIVNPSAFSSGISASLCEMADLTRLEIDLSIQERDIASVKVGQPCLIMPEAYKSDREFLARHPQGYYGDVSRLMPTADRAKERCRCACASGQARSRRKRPASICGRNSAPPYRFCAARRRMRSAGSLGDAGDADPCRPQELTARETLSMSAPAIVRTAGLHKFFRRGSEQIDVLNDLTLEVPEGEFLALMGPSGSGKTTLLNLIAGLDTPSQGTLFVGPDEISRMSESQLARWRTRHVGFVFQFYHLLPVLTAYENVELPLLLLPLSGAERKRQVLTAMDLVGLSNRLTHRPGQLSGGQQQRVGIARAIVTDPTLIVADEPTGDLDSKSAEEILDLLVELKRGLNKTIIMVTHDPRAAARAERTLHLEKGRLVRESTPLSEHQIHHEQMGRNGDAEHVIRLPRGIEEVKRD